MKQFINKYYHLVAFVIISSAPFFWISNKFIIYGPDTMWSINGSDTVGSLLPTWKENVSFGYGWSDNGRVIHNFIVHSLSQLNIDYSIVQKVILFLIIFACTYFTYKLFLELVGDKSEKYKMLALLAVLIFMFNPFAMTWVWWRFLGVMYAYPCWPIVFYVVTRIINGNISYKKITLFVCILSLFAPGVSAPILLLTLFASVFIYFIIRMFTSENNRIQTSKKFIFFWTMYALINSYWLIPGILLLNNSISSALTAYDPIQAFVFNSQHSGLLNTFKGWGATALHIDFFGQSYFGKGVTYLLSSPLYQVVLLLPVLSIITLFANQKRSNMDARHKSVVISVAVLCFIGLFMMKAGNEPLSFINRFALNLPFGAAFRIPYDKFGYFVAISYTIIIPLALLTLRSKWTRRVYVFVCLIYVMVPAYIFFKPYELLVNDKQSLKGNVTQIPDEYKNLDKIGLKNTDRVLVLPTAYNGESSFNWPSGVQANSHDILSDFVSSDIIFLPNGNQSSDSTKKNISNDLFSGLYSSETINDTLNRFGITKIFIHKDWNKGFMLNKQPPPEHYLSAVNKLPENKLIEDNKYFNIYSLNDSSPQYTATSSVLGTDVDNTSQLKQTMLSSDFLGKSAITSTSTHEDQKLIDTGVPDVKPNSIKYSFNISNKNNQLYLNPSILRQYENQSISVALDNAAVKINSNTVGLGKVLQNLKPGTHSIEFSGLKTYSSIGGDLTAIKESLKYDWECGEKFKDNTTQTDFKTISLISNSSNRASCHMIQIEPRSTPTVASMSIEYKTTASNGARIVVYEDDATGEKNRTTQVVNMELPVSTDWKKINLSIATDPGKRYRPIIYSGLNDGVPSKTEYRNFNITSLPKDFEKSFAANQGNEIKIATANAATLSSTKYAYGSMVLLSGELAGKTINTNESYDPLWEAYYAPKNWRPSVADYLFGPSGLKKVNSNNHTLINGYANGWKVNDDAGSILLFYTPQKYSYIGMTISFIALLITSSSILIIVLKKRLKHEDQ